MVAAQPSEWIRLQLRTTVPRCDSVQKIVIHKGMVFSTSSRATWDKDSTEGNEMSWATRLKDQLCHRDSWPNSVVGGPQWPRFAERLLSCGEQGQLIVIARALDKLLSSVGAPCFQ